MRSVLLFAASLSFNSAAEVVFYEMEGFAR